MIKSASLQTTIIDDIDAAVADLAGQLKKKLSLLKNTVGIVQCDPEYIELGIMPLLHEELGITLVGGTTVSIATNDEIGNYIFSVLVLTSDDVEFCAGHTTGLAEDYEKAIAESMQDALGASELPLQMVLLFPTLADDSTLPGDCYVEAVERVCGDVPVFGTLSVDDTIRDFVRSISVYNSKAVALDASYVLVFGNVNPRFFVATVTKQAGLIGSGAIITKSDEHVVKEINEMLPARYFESMELAENGALKPGVRLLAYFITKKNEFGIDGTFVRAMNDLDENGYAGFRGKVPEGATISISAPKADDILDATQEIMERIASEENAQAILIFSCIVRQLSIGSDALKELAVIKDTLRPDVAFTASYSGGEISPIGSGCGQDKYLNTFHNYSLIACVL